MFTRNTLDSSTKRVCGLVQPAEASRAHSWYNINYQFDLCGELLTQPELEFSV